jgi:hypothetical protein
VIAAVEIEIAVGGLIRVVVRKKGVVDPGRDVEFVARVQQPLREGNIG